MSSAVELNLASARVMENLLPNGQQIYVSKCQVRPPEVGEIREKRLYRDTHKTFKTGWP
ncbi:MAG: hypothetical protein KME26_09270 [Oscillatoria princeps RMCB-10]|nr:hypothetical protein [Oscillatoria princeps RMCB-10]